MSNSNGYIALNPTEVEKVDIKAMARETQLDIKDIKHALGISDTEEELPECDAPTLEEARKRFRELINEKNRRAALRKWIEFANNFDEVSEAFYEGQEYIKESEMALKKMIILAGDINHIRECCDQSGGFGEEIIKAGLRKWAGMVSTKDQILEVLPDTESGNEEEETLIRKLAPYFVRS